MNPDPQSQSRRADRYRARIRELCRPYFDAEGRYDGNSGKAGAERSYDHRVVIEVALALLHGDEAQRARAVRILKVNDLVLGRCAFSMDYMMALWHSSAERMLEADRDWLLAYIRERSQTNVNSARRDATLPGAFDITHTGYNMRDNQWHGYNDNHAAMGTSSLILAGELIDQPELVEAGRAALLQARDLLQRRGFINEANDCYLPHTMYPLASIAAWSRDAEIRALAQGVLDRIWIDLLGHWHPNLGHKIGPSARDYTGGRLSGKGWLMLFSYVFGTETLPGGLCLEDIFEPEKTPEHRRMQWRHESGHAWNLGFMARISAQPFIVPETVVPWVEAKSYPWEIVGTNEFGNMLEIWEEVLPDGSRVHHGLDNVQYAGGSHLLTTYLEPDWGMGTADQRLLGSCPNNHWELRYRKTTPFEARHQQGAWYCSLTINDKCVSGTHKLQILEDRPEATWPHGEVHFADGGRYAGIQHQRTAMMLYRPRPAENWALRSLALTLLYPLHFGNTLDGLWFGDRRIEDWDGESADITEIFVSDGPMLIGFRPLIAPWREDLDGPPLPVKTRMRALRRNDWGCIDLINYAGDPIAVRRECDLARLGNGFLVEVATRDEFESMDAFKAWFRRGRLVDDTFHWQRQVRYYRPAGNGQPELDLGLRWDAWQDRVISRIVNGRAQPEPQFHCSGIDPASVPWLTGNPADGDPTRWFSLLVNRPIHRHGHQPLPLRIEPARLVHE